jgi:hypothetical protein
MGYPHWSSIAIDTVIGASVVWLGFPTEAKMGDG